MVLVKFWSNFKNQRQKAERELYPNLVRNPKINASMQLQYSIAL